MKLALTVILNEPLPDGRSVGIKAENIFGGREDNFIDEDQP